MSQGQLFNPQIVHDAAAFLFWTLAEGVGVNGANEAVIDSSGRCLLELPSSGDVLGQYGFQTLPPSDQREFGNAVAAEAERFAVKGENMDGVIYAEDAQSGRAPSAQGVQTEHLRAIPRRVVASGAKILKAGRLCLRHPLPAVVFSDTHPSGGILEVADTAAALGFQLPIFLANVATTQVGDNLFVSTGIFYIPAPDSCYGGKWGSAIQNSSRFVDEFHCYGPDGKTVVKVEW